MLMLVRQCSFLLILFDLNVAEALEQASAIRAADAGMAADVIQSDVNQIAANEEEEVRQRCYCF